MNLFKKLAHDSFWILIARVGAQIFMVIVTFLLARRLGTDGFGEYAFIAAVGMIGNVLTTFGSDMYLIREIAAKSGLTDLSSVFVLQLVLSVLFIIGIFLVSPYLPNQSPESIQALRMYSFAMIPLAFFTVFTSALRGAQKMTAYAWLNFIVPAFQVLLIFFFIQHGTSIITVVSVLLIVQIAAAILAGIFCSMLFSSLWKNLHYSFEKTISLFYACLPIALIAILGILYQRMSLAMLSFLGIASMVGIFSAAARVVEAARLGHISAFTTLYPAMANTNKTSSKTFSLSWLLLLVISIIGSLLMFLFAKPIVDIFYGAEYQSSVAVLKILALTFVPYTVNSFLSLVFLARKQEKTIVYTLTISLLILVMLNLFLIPRVGEVGAGWATLIAEVVQAILYLFAWKRSSFHSFDFVNSRGVSYELPDPS